MLNSLLMFSRLSTSVLIGLSASLLLFSCEGDSKNNSLALIGRWEIVRGYRNKVETETLAGTYFQFGDDGKMQTNLPVSPEEPIAYEVNNTEIRQKCTPPIRYEIINLNDSALVLGLELRGMQFEMHFRRIAKSAGENTPPAGSESDTLLPANLPDSSAHE